MKKPLTLTQDLPLTCCVILGKFEKNFFNQTDKNTYISYLQPLCIFCNFQNFFFCKGLNTSILLDEELHTNNLKYVAEMTKIKYE